MATPSSANAPASPTAAAQRNQRYIYLVARLRNRQMTMEEATELFGLMDGLLRASEAARMALSHVPSGAPPPSTPAAAPRVAPPPATGGDDLLLLGILGIGAGAGLMAAMGRRSQAAPPPSGSEPSRGRRETTGPS